jgi:hypothetical protein
LISFAGMLWWGLMLYGAVRLGGVARLGDVPSPPADFVWPRLSVVIPARDEATRIGGAFATLLEQDYPDLELIPVDDRSTDGTGEVVARLAAGDARVKPVRVETLPDGWLGKVNAMEAGFRRATGEYLLFTDADVHFAPGTLRRAVAFAQARRLDHLSALPSILTSGLLTDLLMISFLRPLLAVVVRPWKVSDPRSGAFCGIGAFNLVRRGRLAERGGFSWLRMEIGDDMGLGLMMKRNGGRSDVVSAAGSVKVRWLSSPIEALRAAERADATALGNSPVQALGVIVGGPLLELAPLWLLLLPLLAPVTWTVPAGGLLLALQIGACSLISIRLGAPLAASLLSPLGSLAGSVGFLRALVISRLRGGVIWRGTLYRRGQLQAGSRIGIGRLREK